MKSIKLLIIRWSVKQIKKLPQDVSYGTLEKYGIADIGFTQDGEKMFILD